MVNDICVIQEISPVYFHYNSELLIITSKNSLNQIFQKDYT